MTENAFFHAFITLRSQCHLHHHSQRALTEITSKITPTLDLSFKLHIFNTNCASVAKIGWLFTHRGVKLHIFNTNGASVAKTGWIFAHRGVLNCTSITQYELCISGKHWQILTHRGGRVAQFLQQRHWQVCQ